MSNYQIAIDGPAGAGKSTIAKQVSAELKFVYIDTGAMYRAMGLCLSEQGIDVENETAVSTACGSVEISIAYEEGVQQVFVNGENVTGRIRTEAAGMAASKVSRYPAVRRQLVALQQKLASTANVVMDGRDIGTKVLPGATLKIFLTAAADVRADRRCRELQEKGVEADHNKILEDILARDYQDTHREESPLLQAEDAILVDTSYLTIPQVTAEILHCFRERV